MRNAFKEEIHALALTDDRVILMMADIGNRMFDGYREEFPERFINCGIAEANMISVASGMAAEGMRPFCYTITPFITYRVMEQIRVDVCYHRQPVIIVGTGAGLSYASLGATHHSMEDMGMLRLFSELVVMCPGDAKEVKGCMRAALKQDRPVYMRIGKKGEPVVHAEIPEIHIGRMLPLQSGKDVCLISAGNMLPVVCEAAKKLKDEGLSATVVSSPTLSPFDHDFLAEALEAYDLVATVEEHSIRGGLATVVAESVVQNNLPNKIVNFAASAGLLHDTSTQASARELYGLTAENIVSVVSRKLNK